MVAVVGAGTVVAVVAVVGAGTVVAVVAVVGAGTVVAVVAVAAGGSTGPGGGSRPGLAVRKFSATREPSASCVIEVIGTSVPRGVKILPPSTERRVRSRSG